jgi:hypothetical protein
MFIAASLVVLLLLAVSDFRPIQVASFGEIPSSGGRFRISCVVIDGKEGQKGWVLTLRDCSGGEVRAFLSRDIATGPPDAGTIVELVGESTEDDRSFVFIESIEATIPPQAPGSSDGKS